MRSLIAALFLLLSACQVGTLPPPEPLPPEADGTPCERLCARIDRLKCAGDQPRPLCVESCQVFSFEAKSQNAPALSWRPECGAKQVTCQDIERCRRGEL